VIEIGENMNSDIQKKYDNEVTLDLRVVWRLIIRNLLPIFIITIALGLVGFGIGKAQEHMNQVGTVTLIVNVPSDFNTGVSADLQANSFETLLQDPKTYQAAHIDRKDVKKSQLEDIQVNADGRDKKSYTNVLTISYSGKNKEEVKQVMALIQKAVPKIAKQNINSIESVKLQQYTINKSVESSASKYTKIGILLGLIVSIGYLLIRIFGDRHYRTVRQLEENLEIPVLGDIPTVITKR
jgi:capsular polysaccharide biosynthesis protein